LIAREAHHQRREKPTETARAADDTADQPGRLPLNL
jgi:hypothetical protein